MFVHEAENPAQVLQGLFAERRQRNGAYSLRSFARDLGLSPARLSHVLDRKIGISETAAQQIARRAGLDAEERERFVTLAAAHHARSRRARDLATAKLARQREALAPLALEAIRALSEWFHFAIVELTLTPGFDPDPAAIARALGIKPGDAARAWNTVERLNLVEKCAGGYRPTGNFVANPLGKSNSSVRQFHRALLFKALEALDTGVAEREFGNVVMAFDRARLDEARAALRDFRIDFDKRFSTGVRDSVYSLSLQFLPLTKSPPPRRDS